MKRKLPTVRGGQSVRRAPERNIAPAERAELRHKLIAIGQIDQVDAATRLAVQLSAALIREGADVAALVTVDHAARAHDAQAALNALLEAGATKATLVGAPDKRALEEAVERMAGPRFIIALGNVLPQLFVPHFTIVVTGHRRSLTGTSQLVLQASLEVTTPSDELATLLARHLLAEGESVVVA